MSELRMVVVVIGILLLLVTFVKASCTAWMMGGGIYTSSGECYVAQAGSKFECGGTKFFDQKSPSTSANSPLCLYLSSGSSSVGGCWPLSQYDGKSTQTTYKATYCCQMYCTSDTSKTMFYYAADEKSKNYYAKFTGMTGSCYSNKLLTDEGCVSPCTSDNDCAGRLSKCNSTNSLCEEKSCSSDSDCGVGYCTGGKCWGIKKCSSDASCQSNTTCINGYCLPDADHDGYCDDKNIPVKYCPAEKQDCDAKSNLCRYYNCTNSDKPGTALPSSAKSPNYRDSTSKDCQDLCIDYDGDGFCSENSVKVYDSKIIADPHVSGMASTMVDVGFGTFTGSSGAATEINDSVYTSQMITYGPATSDLQFLMLAYLYKTKDNAFYDCDDRNQTINPGIEEGDEASHCNLVDDDCDKDIDECADEDYSCVYTSGFIGCQDFDADDDGYYNADFGCPACTDCDDDDSSINPGADDSSSDGTDDNCNGIDGEGADSDGEGIPDAWDICDNDDSVNPINSSGCWYSVSNKNLEGWSTS
ncbi:hypothetical protein KY363_00470 [Candidatus Woesearchaeota archaeon]|nr:hypothetical protein [Candidatus Woesearchaeota archaeon]